MPPCHLDRLSTVLSVSDLAHFLGLSENTFRGRRLPHIALAPLGQVDLEEHDRGIALKVAASGDQLGLLCPIGQTRKTGPTDEGVGSTDTFGQITALRTLTLAGPTTVDEAASLFIGAQRDLVERHRETLARSWRSRARSTRLPLGVLNLGAPPLASRSLARSVPARTRSWAGARPEPHATRVRPRAVL